MQILLAMAAAAGVMTSLPQGEDRGNLVGYIAAFKGLARELEQGGFGDCTQLAAPDLRPKVVSSLMEMVDKYQLDGIDVDLEGELMVKIDQAGNYTTLISALAEQLHARSKVLPAATGSYPGGMLTDSTLPYFDL